jgi:hypothetical protein
VTATASGPRTLKIWADTVRADICRSRLCRKKIWWAQLCKSGKFMCFDEKPEPIVTETEVFTDRQLLTVDASKVHWSSCPGRQQFKRKR